MVDNQEINSQSKMLKFDQVIMLQEMDSYDLFDRIIYVVDPELEVERIIIKAHAVLLYYEILQQEKREFFEVLFGAFIEAYTGRYQQQIYTRKFLIALFRDYYKKLKRIFKRHHVTLDFPDFEWELNFYDEDEYICYEKRKVSDDEYNFLSQKIIVTGIKD